MKAKLIILAAALLALCSGCWDLTDYTVKGYLYTDSTLEVPLTNATLCFFRDGNSIGTAETDSIGRWGLWYNYYGKESYDMYHNSKFSMAEWKMLITYEGDTLYCHYGHNFPGDTLVLYPGITWHHNNWK